MMRTLSGRQWEKQKNLSGNSTLLRRRVEFFAAVWWDSICWFLKSSDLADLFILFIRTVYIISKITSENKNAQNHGFYENQRSSAWNFVIFIFGESRKAYQKSAAGEGISSSIHMNKKRTFLPIGRTVLFWCERGDLNSHVGWHTPLKRACLPVPALSHILQGSDRI